MKKPRYCATLRLLGALPTAQGLFLFRTADKTFLPSLCVHSEFFGCLPGCFLLFRAMKYLENVALETISNFLSSKAIGGGLALNGRIEIYSTKKTTEDKKQARLIEQQLIRQSSTTSEAATSHDNVPVNCSTSPEKKTRKLLIDLIRTLILTHVDYDCSNLSAESFDSMSPTEAISRISGMLAEITVREPTFLVNLWRAVDDAMDKQLHNTIVYILKDPSFMDDPEDGFNWSFHFFFCHKELRRICYFTCAAGNKYRLSRVLRQQQGLYDSEAEDDDDLDDEGSRMDVSGDEEEEEEEEEEDTTFRWHH